MKQIISKPWEVLQIISSRSLSGCLTVSHPNLPESGWKLYLGEGRLHYATLAPVMSQIERLRCLWQNLPWELPIPDFDLKSNQYVDDYDFLCDWKEQHQISITNFRKLIVYLSREALIQAFSFDRVLIGFQPHQNLKQILVAASVADLVKPSIVEMRHWHGMRKFFLSPLSKISLEKKDLNQFCTIWDRVMPSNQDPLVEDTLTMSSWIRLLLDGYNLYELSYHAGVAPLSLSKWLQPYLDNQVLTVSQAQAGNQGLELPPTNVAKSHKPVIACVDDSAETGTDDFGDGGF
jgi:twitching motility two-component system response regulator PilG